MEVYKHGYNAHDNNTRFALQDLATSPNRAVATTDFAMYTQFADGDEYAADKIVLRILDSAAQDGLNLNAYMKAELVVGTLQNLVLYMSILEHIHVAFEECDAGHRQQSLESLDSAVAYYAGSIEGPDQYGAEDVSGSITDPFVDHGQLLYTRSKQFCPAFNSCQGNDDSKGNVAIMAAFSGLAQDLQSNVCDQARQRHDEVIGPLLFVSLVQCLLLLAYESSQSESTEPNTNMVRAYTFAQAVVPYLATIDEDAVTISDLLGFDRPRIPNEAEVETMFATVAGVVQTLSRPALLSQCDAFGQFDPANEGEGQNRDIVPICSEVGETASWTAAPTESHQKIRTPAPTLVSTRKPTIISTAAPGL